MQRGHFLATLLGGALGDTLGMPVEGWKREQIQRHVGSIEEPIDPVIVHDTAGQVVSHDEDGLLLSVSPHLKKGHWTDDTHLAVATARAIVEARRLDLDALARHSLALYEACRQHTNNNHTPASFGRTTLAAFEQLKQGISPLASGVAGRTPGNAPALKMAPVGLYMQATGQYEEGLRFAEQAGKMTHLDPRSVASGIVQAHAIFVLLNGTTRRAFLASLIEVCQHWETSVQQRKKITLAERLQWVAEHGNTDLETAYQVLGPGWPVTRNYPFALFLFQHYWDDPITGLLATVNAGGDCDSTAALYGAWCGAAHGLIFPQVWLDVLENAQELQVLADALYQFERIISE